MLHLQEIVSEIIRRRKILGLTQAELAKQAHVSQSLVAKLESGALSPSYVVVEQILEAIDRFEEKEEETVKRMLTKHVVSVRPSDTIGKAIDLMKSKGFSQLPVMEHASSIGTISEKRILQALEDGHSLAEARKRFVATIMGPTLPIVDIATKKEDALSLLKSHVAVLVTERGKIFGIITRSDAL